MNHYLRKSNRFLKGLTLGSRQPTRLAIMLHPGRTGSTVLGDLLDQNRRIDWASEIFSKIQTSERHYRVKNALWQLRNPVKCAEDGKLLWRESLEARRRRSPCPVLGVEIKTSQVFRQHLFAETLTESLRLLNDQADFPLIFLHRVNHIDRYISAASAQLRSHYNFAKGQTPERIEVPVRRRILDPSYFGEKMEINTWLDEVEKREAEIGAAVKSLGGLVLTYEDDIMPSPLIASQKVIEHLGEESREVGSRFVKIDTRPLAERTSNPGRLRQILRPDLFDKYCGP